LTDPVAVLDELTVTANETVDPAATLTEPVLSVIVVATGWLPPPPPPPLLAPHPRIKHNSPAKPTLLARRFRLFANKMHISSMARAFAKPIVHKPGGGIRLDPDEGGQIKEVVMLEEGGSVAIVNVVEAGAPFERLSGEAGLKEQVAPAMGVLQVKVTVLEMLFMGVRVSCVEPD
jgi:hypothetical protein